MTSLSAAGQYIWFPCRVLGVQDVLWLPSGGVVEGVSGFLEMVLWVPSSNM